MRGGTCLTDRRSWSVKHKKWIGNIADTLLSGVKFEIKIERTTKGVAGSGDRREREPRSGRLSCRVGFGFGSGRVGLVWPNENVGPGSGRVSSWRLLVFFRVRSGIGLTSADIFSGRVGSGGFFGSSQILHLYSRVISGFRSFGPGRVGFRSVWIFLKHGSGLGQFDFPWNSDRVRIGRIFRVRSDFATSWRCFSVQRGEQMGKGAGWVHPQVHNFYSHFWPSDLVKPLRFETLRCVHGTTLGIVIACGSKNIMWECFSTIQYF